MQELIQNILATVDKKGVQRDGKKILKKCSMKSARDTGYVIELAVWLYVYGHDREAAAVCGLLAGETFSGNYTLWDNIDHACCLKARILREQGNLEESRQIIRRVTPSCTAAGSSGLRRLSTTISETVWSITTARRKREVGDY